MLTPEMVHQASHSSMAARQDEPRKSGLASSWCYLCEGSPAAISLPKKCTPAPSIFSGRVLSRSSEKPQHLNVTPRSAGA